MRVSSLPLTLLLILPALCGCKSAMVEATVHNGTRQTIDLIEVDYPSASFGVQALAPGGDFHYRFKIIGSGPLSVTYTDNVHATHTVKGPELTEGESGPLGITLDGTAVQWSPVPKPDSR